MAELVAIPDELISLRSSIDNLDASLIFILSERFKVTKRVGQLKAQHALPATDLRREEDQITRLQQLADEAQLDPAFAERFIRFIIEEVVSQHKTAAGRAALG